MAMRTSLLTLFGLATALIITLGQTRLVCQQRPALELVATDSVPLADEVPLRYLLVPPRCDAGGNTYLRFAASNGDHNVPVDKISATGKTVARPSLAAIPDASLREHAQVRNFAVDNLGRVYLLFSKDSKGFVAAFSAKGEFEKAIALAQPGFFPAKLAIFSSGALLVAGVLRTDDDGPAMGRLFTGVFDASGELVKEVGLPTATSTDDRVPIAAGPGTLMNVPEGVSYSTVLKASDVRKQVTGDDNNAYVLLATSPPLVCVVTADGTLSREMRINPPGPGLVALEPSEEAGKLMVPYGNKNTKGLGTYITQFVVYETATGKELVRYGVSRAPNGYLCCFNSTSATYLLWGDNGRMSLVHAAPR
jgi:hypothetical protein